MDIREVVQELSELSDMNKQITQYTENIESFFSQKLASDESALKAARDTYDTAKLTEEKIERLIYSIESAIDGFYINNQKAPASDISPKATTHLEKALKVAQKELETAKKNSAKLKKAYELIAKKIAPKDVVDTLKTILKKLKKHLISMPTAKDFIYGYDRERYLVSANFSDGSQIQVTKGWGWKSFSDSKKSLLVRINLYFKSDRQTGLETAEEAASVYIKELENKGSPNLVNNDGLNALVQAKIPEIVRTVQRFLERRGDTYNRKVVYDPKEHVIKGETRTHIDQADFGQYDDSWQDMTDEYLNEPFEEVMEQYSKVVANVEGYLGEKGWWVAYVRLKGTPQ